MALTWMMLVMACLTCWWGGAETQAAGDTGVSCKWLLTAGGGVLAAAIWFLVGWVRSTLKELNEEKAGRLNDLRDQFRSAKGN